MKTFKELTKKINEITEPTDAEESRFRARMKKFLLKHHSMIVKKDDIAGNPDSHYTGSTKKRGGKRIADPKKPDDDDAVYEHKGGYGSQGEMSRGNKVDDKNYKKKSYAEFKKSRKNLKTKNESTEDEDFGWIDEVLSPAETAAKERFVKGMKKNKDSLMKRYGDDWQAVMHATATKRAAQTESVEDLDEMLGNLYMKMVQITGKPEQIEKKASPTTLKAMLKVAKKNKNAKAVAEITAKLKGVNESYDGVNSSYIDKISMVADDISQCVDRLVYQHDKYQEEMEDGGDGDSNSPVMTAPSPTGKMYDAKYICRALEDVRDMLRAREIAEAVEDCLETFLDEDIGIEVGDKIKYKKGGKGQARTGVVSMVEGTDIYIHKGATLLNYDDIIIEAVELEMENFDESIQRKVGESEDQHHGRQSKNWQDAHMMHQRLNKNASYWDSAKHAHKVVKEEVEKLDKAGIMSYKDKMSYKDRDDETKKKKPMKKMSYEEAEELEETYTAGKLTLDDKKTINISKKDAVSLNKFYGKLSTQNRKSMEKTLKKSTNDFSEILKFAKEAV